MVQVEDDWRALRPGTRCVGVFVSVLPIDKGRVWDHDDGREERTMRSNDLFRISFSKFFRT